MSASFTRSPGRLDLREAVIFNSHMGLTTQGYLDYAHNRVDLNGTFIPAYQVNSLVTHIPVVGMLLGGGAHEGVFGAQLPDRRAGDRADADRQSAVGDDARLPAQGVRRGRRNGPLTDDTDPSSAPPAGAPATR